MDILDKMPMKFIREFVNKGGDITIERDYPNNEPYLNLNTGMKSHLHLYYEQSAGYTAKCRYNQTYYIETFYDLYSVIRECECNRGFMSGSIEKIYKEGFDNEFDKFE